MVSSANLSTQTLPSSSENDHIIKRFPCVRRKRIFSVRIKFSDMFSLYLFVLTFSWWKEKVFDASHSMHAIAFEWRAAAFHFEFSHNSSSNNLKRGSQSISSKIKA
jgi:hypothetical protein